MRSLTALGLLAESRETQPKPPDPAAPDKVRDRFLVNWNRFYRTARVARHYDAITDFVVMNETSAAAGSSAITVMSGVPNAGKSETGYYVAKRLTRETVEADGELACSYGPETLTRVPVVYVKAAHTNSIKAAIFSPIVHYFTGGVDNRNAALLLRSMTQLAQQHQTRLLIVDDVSQVRIGKNSTGTVDQIKELVEAFPAPILFIGNDLDRDSIFAPNTDNPADPRQQLSGRSRFINCPLWSPEEIEQLARSIERDLPLRDHEPGNLDYRALHARSGGRPRIVSDLLRRAGRNSIKAGTEQITTRDLDQLRP